MYWLLSLFVWPFTRAFARLVDRSLLIWDKLPANHTARKITTRLESIWKTSPEVLKHALVAVFLLCAVSFIEVTIGQAWTTLLSSRWDHPPLEGVLRNMVHLFNLLWVVLFLAYLEPTETIRTHWARRHERLFIYQVIGTGQWGSFTGVKEDVPRDCNEVLVSTPLFWTFAPGPIYSGTWRRYKATGYGFRRIRPHSRVSCWIENNSGERVIFCYYAFTSPLHRARAFRLLTLEQTRCIEGLIGEFQPRELDDTGIPKAEPRQEPRILD